MKRYCVSTAEMGQPEIAEALGVSRQAVQLIEKRALAKLRRECKRYGITVADVVFYMAHGEAGLVRPTRERE